MPQPTRPPQGPGTPLAEFDPDDGLVAPRPPRGSEPFPPAAVLCFFHEVLEELERDGRARRVGAFTRSSGGGTVLAVTTPHGEVTAFNPGVGAPLAALHLEEAIAAGVRDVVACGGAGAVLPGLALGHVVVPTGAVRDEGTSHHYRAADRVVPTDPDVAAHLVGVLERGGVPHSRGLTWTTDAIYRETPARIARRREEGCLTVEMETAALAALCAFRGVRFGQYLYAGDDVSGEVWDHRGWKGAQVRSTLFDLAAEAVATLPPAPAPGVGVGVGVRTAEGGTAGAGRRGH